MKQPGTRIRRLITRGILAGTLLAAAGGSAAAADAAPAAGAPVETVTEELIRLLADRFAISQQDADRLIRRLRDEKAQQVAGAQAAQQPAAPAAAEPPGRVRIVYLPDTEKQRIREEIRKEVIATAEKDNWARPYTLPEWVKNLQISGDIRLREEFALFDSANSPQFINFQAINSGAPQNTNPPVGQPLTFPVLNTTEDRQQTRIRARLGLLTNVADTVTVGMRFSTGNSTNPVSTNQTLGNDFNKLTFVIDRAWLNWRPDASLSLWAGRIPNPWLSTELVWDDDLSFDGVAAQHTYEWSDALGLHTTLGAFSLENTDFNYPSTSLAKESSRDKWLLGIQSGVQWQMQDDMVLNAGLAYYDFVHLRGRISSACFAPNTAVSCDTDNTRPAFLQKGNTLMALRDLTVLTATDPTYQYFGLASPYRVLDLTTRLDRTLHDGRHLVLDADVAWNLAYDRGDIEALVPVNNFGPCPASNPGCTPGFDGGNLAFLVQVLWGQTKIAERGQWNLLFGYRRLESDAVVDAFTDSDFHLGGSNAKGYYIGGNYGIAHNAWLSARWLSATEASGAPLAIDLLQLDLNARF